MIDWVFYIYLGIGIISFVILVIMMALGGLDSLDIDIDVPFVEVDGGGPDVDIDIGGAEGAGPGPFSVPILLCFTSGFGALGAVLTYFNIHPILTAIISIGGSLIIAALIFLLLQLVLKQFASDSTVKFGSLIGEEGTVTVNIRPGSEGQIVVFTEQRGRTLIPAISDRSIPNNARVVIEAWDGNTVKVSRKRSAKRADSNKRKK